MEPTKQKASGQTKQRDRNQEFIVAKEGDT